MRLVTAVVLCTLGVHGAFGARVRAGASGGKVTEAMLDKEDAQFNMVAAENDVFDPHSFAKERKQLLKAEEEADPFAADRFVEATESSDTTGSCMAWKEEEAGGDVNPGFRQGYAAFTVNLQPAAPLFVVVGGQKEESAAFGEGVLDRLDIYTLDLKAHKWAMPTPNGNVAKRVGPAMAWKPAAGGIGGSVVVFGGTSEDKSTMYDDIAVLSVSVQGLQPTFTWSAGAVADGEKPEGRQAASLVALPDGRLLLHGGYRETGTLSDTWLLSEKESKWTWEKVAATGEPSKRKDATLVVWPHCGEAEGDDCVVAFGGHDGEGAVDTAEVLNLGTKSWSKVATSGDVPAPVEGHAAFLIPDTNFMVVHGGCNMAKTTCSGRTLALDLESGEWSEVKLDDKMEVKPKAVEGAVFAPQWDGDAFFMYGGCDPFASECDDRVLALRPKAVCPDGCENGGEYSYADGSCACDEKKYEGDKCEKEKPPMPCPGDCNGHGKCDNGECQCADGWSGADCSVYCPKDCSGHGECTEEKRCECEEGFTGDDCAARTCPDDCSRHGDCDPETGKCACFAGYVEENCGAMDANCPKNCTASENHGECIKDADTGKTKCSCMDGWGGDDCATDVHCEDDMSEEEACNGHGKCKELKCVCDEGFTGAHCTKRTCPKDCSGHGQCNSGTGECACEPGFTDADCTGKFNCEDVNGCSGHGVCVADNECKCEEGFEGEDCSKRSCPRGGTGVEPTECSNHGTCNYQTGKCECSPQWGGSSCDTKCQGNCNGKGACTTSSDGKAVCKCQPGFTGEDCGKKETCPGDCNGKGTCFRGKCLCDPQYSGEDCTAPAACPGNCNGNGKCHNGKCVCAPGFSGQDCAKSAPCPGDCNGSGKCHGGKCVCDPGSKGEDCSEPVPCPGNCNGKGLCEKGQCVCETGFVGDDCSELDEVLLALLPKCPHKCNGHGVCRAGKCFCEPGFDGDACEHRIRDRCPSNCSGNGVCRFRRCFCAPGWEGDDCSFKTPCPGDCSGHGRCDFGKCFCDVGFTGEDCNATYSCPRDCTDRGICLDGKCMCVAGFGGDDCSQATASYDFCPHSCSGHGQCEIGRCFCEPGWTGKGCGVAVESPCPKQCSDNGVCKHGHCFCNPGFEGDDCSVARPCPQGCEEHGVCKYGRCYCAPGFGGENCTTVVSSEEEAGKAEGESADTRHPECPNACSMRGICYRGRCHCEPGFSGEACEVVTVGADQCPNDCRGRSTNADEPAKGLCVLGKCFCYPGWAGDDCGLEVQTPCPDDCNGHGYCHYGRCSCDFGYQGHACGEETAQCEDDCNDHGLCVDGKCKCAKGWTGELCDREAPAACPNDCSDHGACVFGRCYCHAGWDGEDCSETATANRTVGVNAPETDYEATLTNLKGSIFVKNTTEGAHAPLETPGRSSDGRPTADSSASDTAAINDAVGDKDETLTTPDNGSGSGSEEEETGELMQFREASPCPSDCSNRGVCNADGSCTCDPGFAGAGCDEEASCPQGCADHGVCKMGKCFCAPGYEGEDCATEVACPGDCSGNGQCKLGKCFCAPGYEGEDCGTVAACPAGCNGHGDCVNGRCYCHLGFTGLHCADASKSSCPNGCNGHGLCDKGKCFCVQGFAGEDCSPVAVAAAAAAPSTGGALSPRLYGVMGGAFAVVIAVALVVAFQRYSRRSADAQELRAPLSTPAAF